MDLSFWVEIKHNVSVIHLRGRILADNVNLIKELWDSQVKKNSVTIALDCGDVVTVAPPVLRTLTGFLNDSLSRGINFLLLDCNSALKRSLKDNSLIEHFKLSTKAEFDFNFSGKKNGRSAGYSLTV